MAGLEPADGTPIAGGSLLPAGLRTVSLEQLQRWQMLLSIAASIVVIAAGVTTILQRKR